MTDVAATTTAPPGPTPPCFDDGDTAWVLVSTILVLGMMPALAFFEAGLLRSKNTLSILTQIFAGLAVLAVMWHILGFSLVYGESQGGFIGNVEYAFWRNIHDLSCMPGQTIPILTFALFQLMFAAITPLLVTGSIAERMKIKVFILFVVFWEAVIYYPLAHWIWNDGGWLAKQGVMDFAGGIVIHTSAGTSSLVIAKLLGKRASFDQHHGEVPPHNIPLAAIGAALLWMGWYGFNAGSALASGGLSTIAVANTTVAATVSTCVWLVLSMLHHGHVSTLAILNGAIAGLAGITPASGFIEPAWASLVSVAIGVGGFYSIFLFKGILKVDDALDVSSVHGVTGIIGSLAIGIFASQDINPNGNDGWIHGNPKQLAVQLLGVVMAAVWAGFWSAAFILPVKYLKKDWLKLSKAEEEIGLDYIEHGKVSAYLDLERKEPVDDWTLLDSNGHEKVPDEDTALVN